MRADATSASSNTATAARPLAARWSPSPADAPRRSRAQHRNELGPVAYAVAAVEPGQVRLDRLHRQERGRRDLAVGGAGQEQVDDALLAGGEPGRRRTVQ